MTQAVVRKHPETGELYLDDPDALALFKAVAKHNCFNTMDIQLDRVQHFIQRIKDLGNSPSEVCIVLIHVDAPYGAEIADALMPGFDWQAVRDAGQVPFARGLAAREGMTTIVGHIDPDTKQKMLDAGPDAICVVVVDHGTVEVFTV